MNTGIYKITSPTNKIYIGQSINLKKRFNTYNKLRCKGQPKLYNSLIKYGWVNHIFEIIEECEIVKLNEREIYWGNYYNVLGENGLNCKECGLGGKLSQETKDKISNSLKNRDISSWKHKIHNEETYIKIGLGNKGKKVSDEAKKKMGKSKIGNKNCLGRILSNETKQKMKKAKLGISHTKEHKDNMRKGMLGKNTTPIICINTNIKYSSIREAAILLNLNERAIGNHLNGITKTTNKLTFKYI